MKSFDSVAITNNDYRMEAQTAMLQGSIGCIDQLIESVEIDACKDLWLAVLEQAIKDARGTRIYYSVVEEARDWFKSENEDPGSFLWICRLLGLDPEAVKNTVEKEYYYEAA